MICTKLTKGQLAGLYPKNPLMAAMVDEVTASVEDTMGVANSVKEKVCDRVSKWLILYFLECFI